MVLNDPPKDGSRSDRCCHRKRPSKRVSASRVGSFKVADFLVVHRFRSR
jgi:hypothetical protein